MNQSQSVCAEMFEGDRIEAKALRRQLKNEYQHARRSHHFAITEMDQLWRGLGVELAVTPTDEQPAVIRRAWEDKAGLLMPPDDTLP